MNQLACNCVASVCIHSHLRVLSKLSITMATESPHGVVVDLESLDAPASAKFSHFQQAMESIFPDSEANIHADADYLKSRVEQQLGKLCDLLPKASEAQKSAPASPPPDEYSLEAAFGIALKHNYVDMRGAPWSSLGEGEGGQLNAESAVQLTQRVRRAAEFQTGMGRWKI